MLTKDIGMVQGLKRAHHKEARLASIEVRSHSFISGMSMESTKYQSCSSQAGREGRESFAKKLMRSNPNASTSNKEKKKLKPFMMIRPMLKRKNKRSFVQKQVCSRMSLFFFGC